MLLHYLKLHKNRKVVFLSMVALKRTGFGLSAVAQKRATEPVVCLDHSRCLKWRPFAFMHAHPCLHRSMALSMMPWGIRSSLSMSLCFSSSCHVSVLC